MPHGEARYRFEFVVLGGLGALSVRLLGPANAALGCKLLLDHSGSLREVYPGTLGPLFRDMPVPPDGSWILLDAFDAPLYTYVAWGGIDQVVMERLLDLRFAEADWMALDQRTPACAGFPPTHSVML